MNTSAATQDPGTERVRISRPKRIFRVYVAVVLCLYAVYLVRRIEYDPPNWRWFLEVGAIFAGSSIGLAWLTRQAWTRITITVVRYALTIALAWHALFGAAMLLDRILTQIGSNKDLGIVLWPHVVHWINSAE